MPGLSRFSRWTRRAHQGGHEHEQEQEQLQYEHAQEEQRQEQASFARTEGKQVGNRIHKRTYAVHDCILVRSQFYRIYMVLANTKNQSSHSRLRGWSAFLWQESRQAQMCTHQLPQNWNNAHKYFL